MNLSEIKNLLPKYYTTKRHSGMEISVSWPNWLKKFLLERKGKCAQESFEFPGWFCSHEKNHKGMHGYSP